MGVKKTKRQKNKYHGAIKFLIIPDKKWVHISIDFTIDFAVNPDFLKKKNCINTMVIMDRLNKMVKCIFMDGLTIKSSARAFYIHVWKNYGLLKFIISNLGRPVVNHFWEQLITKLRISTNFSTIYHPEIDGQTEIRNSVFEQYFKIYMNFSQDDWVFWLPPTEFVIKTTFQKQRNAFFFKKLGTIF